MPAVPTVLDQLTALCDSINTFISASLPVATYRAPVIDWHHPDDYAQGGIAGLKKFLGSVEAERAHVTSLAESVIAVNEFSTNAPHLTAVWEEFIRARLPISGINQTIRCGLFGNAKVDVIADGGKEWIKVNTIQEKRLLHEFREQDSYINSDYESDSPESHTTAGPSRPVFSNSVIKLGESLIKAAKHYHSGDSCGHPRIKMVLNRLERPVDGFGDPRIDQTIDHLKSIGLTVQLGQSPHQPFPMTLRPRQQLRPTRNIVLDLSVLVALCCDSTHHLLPSTPEGFELRFRPLTIRGNRLDLAPHINTTRDLRDQLQWESAHPLVQELKDRLSPVVRDEEAVQFWVTREVRDRLPGLVNVIGGPEEQRRGQALFREDNRGEEESPFWVSSRWQGNEGVLRDIRVQVLPATADLNGLGVETRTKLSHRQPDLPEEPLRNVGIRVTANQDPRPTFSQLLTSTCLTMIDKLGVETNPPTDLNGEDNKSTPDPHWSEVYRHRLLPAGIHQTSHPSSQSKSSVCTVPAEDNTSEPGHCSARIPKPKPKQQTRTSRAPHRPNTSFPPTTRLPSQHTLWTLLAGASRGWTVLTNNRGAVGKVCREMGIESGLSVSNGDQVQAAIWVVNPSSLSEWRRKEVLRENDRVRGDFERCGAGGGS